MNALSRQGGEDIKKIILPKKLDTISEIVIVTGNSKRHLKKMAQSIVSAVINIDKLIATLIIIDYFQ